MYRASKLREIRQKQAEAAREAAEEAALEAEAAGVTPSSASSRTDEPRVATSPFQAMRLLRAFDVFPERDAQISFWTRLNVDLTRESVRGTCHLPHGLDTKIHVLAFCPDDEVQEMLEYGADTAGLAEPIRKINQGWLGFDRCLATPNVMPQVMKVAKILGPRKLMPNPKSGTVVTNLKQAIKEAKGGTLLEFRAEGDGAAEVEVAIADANFSDAKVLENMKFFVQTLLRARPRGGGATKAQSASLLPEQQQGAAAEETKDQYFLEAKLQMGSLGPPIQVDPVSMLPASVGYFR